MSVLVNVSHLCRLIVPVFSAFLVLDDAQRVDPQIFDLQCATYFDRIPKVGSEIALCNLFFEVFESLLRCFINGVGEFGAPAVAETGVFHIPYILTKDNRVFVEFEKSEWTFELIVVLSLESASAVGLGTFAKPATHYFLGRFRISTFWQATVDFSDLEWSVQIP